MRVSLSTSVFVCFCVIFLCGVLWSVYASTFVTVSPTDYQNILAELRSPAAMLSDTQFLEPELPVTPDLFPVHHQHCLNVTLTGSQPPPWSPPRTPPRPCELVLRVPASELPDPIPPKVRRPHIALNDQLLLSEEEDRVYQEVEPSKSKSHPVLAECEVDTDMAFSTSSPSLTSISSITPSSPDRTQTTGGRHTCVLIGRQEVVGSKEGTKEVTVAGVAAAELEGDVKKWLKPDFIENVDRKCEMIIKDKCKWAEEETKALLERGARSLENEKLVVEMKGGGHRMEGRDVLSRSRPPGSEFKNNNKLRPQPLEKTLEGEKFEGGREAKAYRGGKMGAADENLEWTDKEGLPDTHADVCPASEGDVVAEGKTVARLCPHFWRDPLSTLGSTEEEEEGRGTEGQKELKGVTKVRLEEMLDQVEQTEQEVLSLVGWHSDSSSVNVEPPTPGRSVSSDLLDRRER